MNNAAASLVAPHPNKFEGARRRSWRAREDRGLWWRRGWVETRVLRPILIRLLPFALLSGRRFYIQESPHFGATAIYQFLTPFVNAFLAFAASLALYWIKDHDPSTREFERQTKRLQFWKTFYDLQAVAPIKSNVEHELRCRQTVENAAFWVEAIPTKAFKWAKRLTVMLIGVLTAWFYTTIIATMPLPPVGHQSGYVLFQWIFLASFMYLIYQIVYEGLKTQLTRWFLWLAEHVGCCSFFKEMAE